METQQVTPGSIANPVKFWGQDYVALLDACIKSGSLFSDTTFAPDQSSIGMPTDPDPKKEIKWLRPKEISANAVFVEDTTCTTDICQGQLGNCWLLAALSCLTMHPNLFVKVVPPNQSLTESYAGIFHFMFWQYGEWVEVVVDDRLPVREGRLLFSYSCTRNEYWSALVEKAYAKLIGSYGSLKGGNISEAMEDFTGGIAYSLPVSSRTPRVMWRALSAALSRGSLLSCFIQASNYREIGTVTAEGLVKGHAYAITDTDTAAQPAPRHPPAGLGKVSDLSADPAEYQNLREVFNKARATSLPPHRPDNCAIDLLRGTTPPRGWLYSLSGPETKAMEEYIEDSLAAGSIRPSESPADAGFFFVEKTDKTLRPCINYRGLNDITSEQANQDLETTLRCLVSANPTTWSQQLVWVEYACNTLPCSATGLLPFEGSLGYQSPLFPEQEDVSLPSAQMFVPGREPGPLFLRPPPGIRTTGPPLSSPAEGSFWKNPQFQLVLAEQDKEEEDDEDEDEEMTPEEKMVAEKQKKKAKQCTVLVELLQKDRRKRKKIYFLHIAFHIYRVPPELRGLCLDQSFFSNQHPVGRSGKYQPLRAVWRKVRLDPGNYVILASTYMPNVPAEFFLRVYSKTGNNLGTQDFTCSTGFLMVMSMPPVLPEDRKRVQKTFDEVAGPDDKLNAKEFMKLVNSGSFWKNPQFQLVLAEQDKEEEDDEDEDEEMTPEEKMVAEKQKKKAKQCTVLVELLQKDRRKRKKIYFLHIAFHIYRVPPELRGLCLDQSFFSNQHPVGRSGKYQPLRAVWRKVRLDPGNYVILASTYMPNVPAEFFLRVYSKTGNNLGTQDFTCSTGFLMVMSMPPVLPEDRKRVQKTFDEVAGPDDKLNAKEFMKLVNSVLEKDYQLPLETCRQLIFGEDTGGRSSLTREQTEPLLASLRSLQSIFFKFDQDSSGTMSPFELSLTLQAAGVQCDGQVIQLLWERFGSGELHLPFHGFVACVTRLRKLFALFKSESNPEIKGVEINAWLLRLLTL
ncbi:calpain-2 catalytic subunit-like [Salvelinus alpinus]